MENQYLTFNLTVSSNKRFDSMIPYTLNVSPGILTSPVGGVSVMLVVCV